MKVQIIILLHHHVSLPKTAVCTVELRDVSLIDAPSITLCAHQAPIEKISGTTVMSVTLEVPDIQIAGRRVNVWAHLSLTGAKGIKRGDFITMQAYPINVKATSYSITVELQPVN